ncbi:hypothetical protein [Citrobacter enshiensis]
MLPNIHASVLPAISGLNSVDKRQAVGIVETVERGGMHQRR